MITLGFILNQTKWKFINIICLTNKIKKEIIKKTYNITKINFILKNFNFILINFFKEGMLIDALQKLSADKLLKTLFIESSQFFNLNFYNTLFIKFFINEFYYKLNNLFFKNININLYSLFNNIIFLVMYLIGFIFLIFGVLIFFL